MLKSFGVLCGGDSGVVVAAREFLVAVRRVDRRVLLVHGSSEVELVTCVWSRIGQAPRDIPLQ